MKFRRVACLLLALLPFLGGGCNLMRVAFFRSQMQDIAKYTAWEDGSADLAFVFRAPLFTVGDLKGFGIFPEMLDERNGVLRYQRVDAPAQPRAYDIRLQFADGRLSGLVFPAPIRDGLGKENITLFFAMMGWRSRPGLGMVPVTKAQLMSSGLVSGQPDLLGPEVRVDLRPQDSRNQSIVIKLKDTRGTGSYGSFSFIFEKPGRG